MICITFCWDSLGFRADRRDETSLTSRFYSGVAPAAVLGRFSLAANEFAVSAIIYTAAFGERSFFRHTSGSTRAADGERL